jgi:hypothetical protein
MRPQHRPGSAVPATDGPSDLPGRKLLAFTHQGQPRVYSTKGKLLAAPDIWCPPLNRSIGRNELLCFMGEGDEAEMGMFKGLDGKVPEIRTMIRAELLDAEDGDWMQDLARMLCPDNADEAAELLQQWRDCVAGPPLPAWAGMRTRTNSTPR